MMIMAQPGIFLFSFALNWHWQSGSMRRLGTLSWTVLLYICKLKIESSAIKILKKISIQSYYLFVQKVIFVKHKKSYHLSVYSLKIFFGVYPNDHLEWSFIAAEFRAGGDFGEEEECSIHRGIPWATWISEEKAAGQLLLGLLLLKKALQVLWVQIENYDF